MSELRECPFCGSTCCTDRRPVAVFAWRIVCEGCSTSSDNYLTKKDAISAWNRRSSDRYTVTDAGKAALRGER